MQTNKNKSIEWMHVIPINGVVNIKLLQDFTIFGEFRAHILWLGRKFSNIRPIFAIESLKPMYFGVFYRFVTSKLVLYAFLYKMYIWAFWIRYGDYSPGRRNQ